tara:strand:+ start:1405 stop:1710 length:306 start_codon:yes stop_codon:yes gene_type:complete
MRMTSDDGDEYTINPDLFRLSNRDLIQEIISLVPREELLELNFIKENKVTVQIGFGCPTGSTVDYTRYDKVEVDEDMAQDYVSMVMDYALELAGQEGWRSD